MKKIISLLLSLVLVFSLSVPALAADQSNNNTLSETPALTQQQKELLNEWVGYDDSTKEFSIKEGAKATLSESDYTLLNTCITVTNSNLKKADFSSGEVFVVSPEQEGQEISLYYSEGVTKIEFHWWGATIYLSKSTINLIGAGVSIGGIWVPEPIVSKVLATLGVVVALCPGGIAFDYNYILAGITSLIPGTDIVFSAISNVRWQ